MALLGGPKSGMDMVVVVVWSLGIASVHRIRLCSCQLLFMYQGSENSLLSILPPLPPDAVVCFTLWHSMRLSLR